MHEIENRSDPTVIDMAPGVMFVLAKHGGTLSCRRTSGRCCDGPPDAMALDGNGRPHRRDDPSPAQPCDTPTCVRQSPYLKSPTFMCARVLPLSGRAATVRHLNDTVCAHERTNHRERRPLPALDPEAASSGMDSRHRRGPGRSGGRTARDTT